MTGVAECGLRFGEYGVRFWNEDVTGSEDPLVYEAFLINKAFLDPRNFNEVDNAGGNVVDGVAELPRNTRWKLLLPFALFNTFLPAKLCADEL